jgi:hypothetical protein
MNVIRQTREITPKIQGSEILRHESTRMGATTKIRFRAKARLFECLLRKTIFVLFVVFCKRDSAPVPISVIRVIRGYFSFGARETTILDTNFTNHHE